MACELCGEKDIYTEVTGKPSCSICTVKYVGHLPGERQRIAKIREQLGLNAGEFLKQDRAVEAKKILGR